MLPRAMKITKKHAIEVLTSFLIAVFFILTSVEMVSFNSKRF